MGDAMREIPVQPDLVALVDDDPEAQVQPVLDKLAQTIQAAEKLAEALTFIALGSRGVPDQLGCDKDGDCTLSDCTCSNHIARAALAQYAATKAMSVYLGNPKAEH